MSEAAIVHWLSHNGAEVHPSIQISRSPSGEQVISSTDNIPASTTLLNIPASAIITATNSSLLERIPSLAEKSQWTILILTIMYEASKPDSQWRSYFDSLPIEFDTLMYWSQDELKELEGSAVLNKIGKEEAETMYLEEIKTFVDANGDVFGGVDVSLEAFHKAGSWIMAFSSDFEKPGHTRDEDAMDDDDDDEYDSLDTDKVLVPFGNLIQIDCNLANCEFLPSEGSVSLVSTRDISTGTALYSDPGPVPRSDLLRRVGRYPQSSTQHDVIEIDSTLLISVAGKNLSDSTRDSRIERLVEEELLEDSYDIEADGGISSEILIVIQAFSVDDETFQSYATEEKFPKARKDARTRDVILEAIQKRREGFATSREEDIAILGNSGEALGRRNKMAVEVRLGEKEILRKMEEVVRSWADTTENQSRSAKRQKR
ncbi:hypothetical protein TWF225_010250 [Orbilia oligospora]|nr:hypothetical protein TWF225_010250 [Orbilia oligospora]KAF3249699.1 hypothetical protein TWF128_007711 [Orbilia oligospora]KAF3261525.1 hypothetical protein TWF217_004652 [Orbilia oligospora]KAF3298542.1 hypothetical protein TWF132_000347 [Orbilia oligospora]